MDGTVVGTLGKRRRMRTFVRPRPPKDAGVDKATEADAASAVWAFDDRSISEKGMQAPPAPASGTHLQPPAAMFMSVYQFDRVFSCQADNYDVYDHAAKGIVQRFCDGRNGTILIYGQTSTGKTNTVLGNSEDPGIVAWSVSDIFSHISESMGREFLLRVSCFELHCEVVKDLLKPDTASTLNVYEDPVRGFCVAALTEQVVGSAEQIMELLLFAEANRHVNTHSKHSRSHTVFRLLLESGQRAVATEDNGEAAINNIVHAGQHAPPISVSSLHIVDLAGSEGARARASSGGASRTQLINKSLNQLHTVVTALSKGSTGAAQVPYHGSILTQILRESLGGNSDAALICTISIAKAHQLHTRRSLQFASSCATIQNSPCIQQIPAAQAMLPKWVAEMNSLQQQISTTTAASQANQQSDNETHQEMVMRSLQKAQREAGLASLEDKLEDMRKFLLVPESVKRFEQTLSTLAADVQNHLGGNQQRHRFMSPELLSTLDTLKDMCNVEHFWKRDAVDGTATDRSSSHGNLLFILNKSLLQAKEQARMLRSALVEQEGELDETRCMLEQELDRNPVRRLASPSKASRDAAVGANRSSNASSVSVGTPIQRSSAKKRAVRRASLTTPNVPESSPKVSARRHSFSTGRRRSISRRRPSLSNGVMQSSNQKQDVKKHSTAIAQLVEECSEPETMLDAAIYFGRDERIVVQVNADTKPQEVAATLIRQHNLPRDLLGSVAAQLGEALVEALKRELARSRSHAKKSVELLLSAPPSESLNSEMSVRLEHAEARAAEANEELAFLQQCKIGPLQEECSMLQVEHEKLKAEIESNKSKVQGAQDSKVELEGQVKALEAVLQRYSREAGRAHNSSAIREGRHEIRGLKRRVDQLEALLLAKEEMLRMAQVKIEALSAARNTPGSPTIFDALYSPLMRSAPSDEGLGEMRLPSTAALTHGVSASEAANPTVSSTPRSTGTSTDVSTSLFPTAINTPQVVASISGGMETTATSQPVATSIATDQPSKTVPARRATGLGRLFGANSGQVGSSQVNDDGVAPVHRRSFTHDDDEPATLLDAVQSMATSYAPKCEQKHQMKRNCESSQVSTSHLLQQIFDRFMTTDRTSKVQQVTLFQLHQCCRDAKISGASDSAKMSTVLRGDIDTIFSRVRGKSKGSVGLSFAQFCNAMELLAYKKFAGMLENQELQRSDALDELCQLLLRPFALDVGLLALPGTTAPSRVS